MTDEIVSTAAKPGERPSRDEYSLDDVHSPCPTRIAFCITDLDVGGAEKMFVELVTRLDRRLWEPRVFCLSNRGKLVERLMAENISVVCFDVKTIRQISVFWKLAAELKHFRPALIQCFLYHANLVGRIAAWWAGIPLVICGIRVAERRSRLRLWLDKLTQGLVAHNVCVSQAVADFSVDLGRLSRKKVSVIPNAVEFDSFSGAKPLDRSTLGISADVPVVLFVGRLDPQKAPFVLLEAFKRLLVRHPNWRLLFVGDGVLRGPMNEWIAENELSNSIHLTGWRADIPGLLKTANCLALPSLWEGMPNIVLEAMASGLPVVVSQVEGTAELIQHGETGLLVKPGSADDLEQAIESVLIDTGLSNRLLKNAQHLCKEVFTIEKMVTQYCLLYRGLLSKRLSPQADITARKKSERGN